LSNDFEITGRGHIKTGKGIGGENVDDNQVKRIAPKKKDIGSTWSL
jgi:hypothetical protein